MNVPKLRFKEFNDEWKTELFKNVFEFSPNNSLSRNDLNYNNQTNILNIHYGDILVKINNILDINSFELPSININHYEKLNNKKNFLTSGDIVIADTAEDYTAGKVIELYAVENKKIISGLHTIPIHPTIKFSPKFLGYYMNSNYYHNQLIPLITGIKVMSISKGNLENTYINYPQNIEQEKIGKFLSLLDKKIELQSKKIDALKLYTKKQKNDMLNEHKFNSREYYIEDICKIQTGKSNTQDKNKNGIYPFYIRSEQIEYSDKYIFDCEAVLTIGDGNIGKVFFYANGKFDCHQRVYVMNNFSNLILGKYFYYYFSNNFYKRAMQMSAKNTVDSVRYDMISKMKITIPSIQIQKNIINFLDVLENKLHLEQEKLSKLESLKKGLMQNMFV